MASSHRAHRTALLLAALLPTLAAAAGQATPTEPVIPVTVAGNADTQAQWARRYELGDGVARDPLRALVLYCAAAQAGNLEARYRLGWSYANGLLGVRDDALAAAWLAPAAAAGDRPAANLLQRLAGSAGKAGEHCRGSAGTYLVNSPAASDTDRAGVEQLVRTLAPTYRLDPDMVLAVIRVESRFDPKARSPKGALGLMQLIPATARRFGVEDPLDPLQNLRGGMAYLRWLLDHFAGDLRLALAGYNAGEGAVTRYRGIPPYPETQDYVRRVTRAYGAAGNDSDS